LPANLKVSVGDRVGLEFRPDRISLFDAASGRAILTALHDHAPAMELAHG
jgi:multiple sugar transport system ATP-binding protein